LEGFRKFLDFFLDLLFPPKCLLCKRLNSNLICPECLSQLTPFRGKTCSLCGVPLEGKDNRCPQCLRNPPYFDRGFFYGLYQGKLEEAILRFKYQDHPGLSAPLGKLLAEKFRETGVQVDLVTWVPLHQRKLKMRGYNQAELLARAISVNLGLPYGDLLIKKKETKPQSRLSREERLKNVIGVFKPKSAVELQGKSLLLVDDVVTTGATASECARVLKEMGAEKVFVLSLARGTGTQRPIS
jgi:ComF family protein